MMDVTNQINIFSERLVQARNNKKLTSSHVSMVIGVSVISYYQWEHGTMTPSLKHLLELAEVLGVSLDWLCGREQS